MQSFRVFSRRHLFYPSRRSSLNPRPVNLLQPLSRRQRSQLLYYQANPASFCKTPGVGAPLRKLVPCTEAQKGLSVSPLLATLMHSLSRKSFPCHSYANTRDGGVTMPFQFFPSALCFSVPARRPAGGPLPAPRLGRGGKSLFSSSLPYLFRYVSTPELLLPSIHSANITKVQTRGAAGVAGSRADKPWQP